jgi:tetratricopeptide (TPR) repeat protein
MNERKTYEGLGNVLDHIEIDISRLEQGLTVNCVEILHQMDDVKARLDIYQKEGRSSVSSEIAQFEFVSANLRKNARRILHGIGSGDKLQDLRKKEKPSTEQWWWYLDSYLLDQQKRGVRKVLIRIGITASVLIALIIIYNRFLAPDPATQAKYSFLSKANVLIATGDFKGALDALDKALVYAEDDTDLLIMRGVLLELLGRSDEASLVYEKASNLLNNQEKFLISRSMTFLTVGDPSAAIADSEEAMKINPKSPEAAFQLARCFDLSGQTINAIQTYQIASDLATEQGKPELNVIIRSNMANALQRIGMPDTPQLVLTITPKK